MTSSPLDNLVRIGKPKAEPPAQAEFAGLVRSGLVGLRDAENATLSLESRFDLAYNAAHALSLAALRWHGYRSENRYLVFQSLHTRSRWMPRNGACSIRRTTSATWPNTKATWMWTMRW